MTFHLASIALLVPDYDPAIAYFTDVLGFALVEDTPLGGEKRWVVVQPPGGGSALLLARASDDRQRAAIGNQTGGRVGFFLKADDFTTTYQALLAKGVRFLEEPRHEAYGMVAVFEDLMGNRWDLIGPA